MAYPIQQYARAYGSRYVDPYSGLSSTIYPPALLGANNNPKISLSKNWGGIDSQSLAGSFNNLSKGPGNLSSLSNFTHSVGSEGEAIRNAAGAAGNAANGLGSKIGDLGTWFGNNFGWGKTSGLKMFGKNIGKAANIGSGIMYGLDAINGMGDLSNTQSQTDDLLTDILRSSASNPLLNSYLTSDQMSMLNKIKRGNYSTEASATDFDLMGLLSSAGQGALTGGLTGGIPGAVIGALGGGITSNIERQNQDQQRINSELEGLLQALTDAEAQYNMMKRPNFTGLGIQSRYQNMYM